MQEGSASLSISLLHVAHHAYTHAWDPSSSASRILADDNDDDAREDLCVPREAAALVTHTHSHSHSRPQSAVEEQRQP